MFPSMSGAQVPAIAETTEILGQLKHARVELERSASVAISSLRTPALKRTELRLERRYA
jgi:hypothetical protein